MELILAKVIYDGKLSDTAYIILAVMILIIVGGLGWCFYRAAKAAKHHLTNANEDNSQEQYPDEE